MESILFVPVTRGKIFMGILIACDPTLRKFSPADERLLILFGNQTAVALENSRMFTEMQEHTLELETLSKISESLRPVQRSTELMPVILKKLVKLTRASLAAYLKPGNDKLDWVVGNSVGDPAPPPDTVLMPGLKDFIRSKEGIVINLSELNSKEFNTKHGFLKKNKFGLFIPMFSQEEKSGYLFLAGEKSFEPNIIQIIRAVSDMAANAIQRATLHEETRKRLDYISALHTIDSAITSSSDLAFTLSILVDQIKDKLKVDAVTILLRDRTTNYLNHAASIGFYNSIVKKIRIRIGESYAGKAATERQLFRIQDYDLNSNSILQTSPFLKNESFVEFIGNPLIVKGKLVGVLEIFNRQPLEVDEEWFHFMNSIAQQAAIAIDNSRLFEELEKSNINLLSAYDSTLEGWSRALEMRDRETEGHSKRVVDLTVEIALQMGLPSEQLIHIRRGALLHDIGKLGIPDSILLKPGILTPDERKVMEQHPIFAKDLLSTIDYLKPVINIPYCHHEKWDGSGYPNGLSGELIPIEARIFAIIDVFDALTSDRPYRKAWTQEASLEYINEQSGKYFDPAVVKIFLTLNPSQGQG
jgi:HD-GYP domain-containing protein (c-di-GMP phosphodiesterase class II)